MNDANVFFFFLCGSDIQRLDGTLIVIGSLKILREFPRRASYGLCVAVTVFFPVRLHTPSERARLFAWPAFPGYLWRESAPRMLSDAIRVLNVASA